LTVRIGLAGIMHESNTFIASPTTLDDFRRDLLLTGDEVRAGLGGTHHEVAGALETLDAAGAEAVPLLFARAVPSGTIADEALEALLARLWDRLERAGPLDGLLVSPHGANVSERHPDMDGHWLSLLRARVGPRVPIVATLDPHANLSPAMVGAVDALTAYRTNPHLDQRARGAEAATLLLRTLGGEVRPVTRGAFPPVAINIERQAPAEPHARPLYELAEAIRGRPGVLSASICLGFPYADVEEMGSAVAVVTDGDPGLAGRLAGELAARLVADRHAFVGEFVTAAQAVAGALAGPGPVCLLDMGDNVGAGAPGDGTLIARELDRAAAAGAGPARGFVSLWDPAAVRRALEAGPGGRLRLAMGGWSDPVYGPPLDAEVTVRGVHDGRFHEPEVRHYGMTDWDMGRTVVVETARGLTVQLTSNRVYPTSLGQLTSCGVDPRRFQVLVAKGVHAPVAAYAPVSARLVRVDTPGFTCADMRQLAYRRRRRPLFPFEEP
jgi:microcystin degradation protein MlrC